MLARLRNLIKWVRVGEEKTVEAIIIEVHRITTVPTILTTINNKPLKGPCALLIITSEEVVRNVEYEQGTEYPLPPPRSLPSPGDKAFNSRIVLNCFWSIPRSEDLIKDIKDLLVRLDSAFRPREVFARIIYTDGSAEYVEPQS